MAPLDQARWQRVREIFEAIADLPSDVVVERLTALCGHDHQLRAEVETLLAHDRAVDDPIGRAVVRAARGAAEETVATGAGRRLLHYRLTEPIGEGGMGVVWRAADETLGRDVAIKLLPRSLGHDERRLARFEREAKLLASLNHTNIAAIFSLHALDDVRFLAMEFVPGEDLAARLARGPMSLDEAVRVALQIAEALEEAHERGVVHRDLKPANVRLTPSGKVKVLDFGLAKAFADDLAGGSSTSSAAVLEPLSTRDGVVLGTAAYMPPEQARGAAVDKRSDIWAFGVVLFEMLAGRRPFAGGTTVDQLAAIITAEPDWTMLPEDTPKGLVRLLQRCLHKDARRRLRDIGEARIELELVAAEAALPPPPEPEPGGVARWRGGRALVAAAVVAAVMGAFSLGRQSSALDTPRATAPSLAVLPLLDLSAGPHEDYFADGLTEELLNLLARNPQLRVVGRTSSFRFRGASGDLRAIGRTLGVSSLLEGSVRRSGTNVRINVQLVNAEDGFHLWSSSYDRDLDGLLQVQDEIAGAVASALQVSSPGGVSPAPPPGGNGPAYNAFLQGKYFRGRNTRDGLDKAAAYFEEAVRLDPGFARAWAGLSYTRTAMGAEGYVLPGTVAGEARRAAERAIELDPELADGHAALSAVRRAYDWDWNGADAAAQRALQLEPNNADIVLGAARVASALGRLDEAILLTSRAATLNPLNVTVHYRLGRYQQVVGQLDAARTSLTKVLELDDDYPAAHENLGLVLLAQGQADAGLAELAREANDAWREHGLAIAYHLLNRPAEADAALARLVASHQDVAAVQIAQIHALRGRPEAAMDWLDRAYLQRDTGLSQLKSTAYFDRLAGEPRYQTFLDKMRLPR